MLDYIIFHVICIVLAFPLYLIAYKNMYSKVKPKNRFLLYTYLTVAPLMAANITLYFILVPFKLAYIKYKQSKSNPFS